MKLRSINVLTLFFISFLAFSSIANAKNGKDIEEEVVKAELKFTQWDEKITFTEFGRTVEVSAELSVALPKNSYIDNWTYVFSEDQEIKILQTLINGKVGNYNFADNNLRFQFDKIGNKETLKIKLTYENHNKNGNLYFRQEAVVIPKWLKDAKSKIEVNIPSSHILCSIHPDFKSSSSSDKFTWSGIISDQGLTEVFIITPTNGRWEVTVKNIINGLKNYRELELMYPIYFQNNGQNVEYYNISNSVQPVLQKDRAGYHIFEYSYAKGRIETDIKAIINNGIDNYYSFNLDSKRFLTYPEEDRLAIDEILKIIRRKPNPNKLPEYIMIAQWVHDNIKYDLDFAGKKMTDTEILKAKKGICEHYAQLYRDLCRYAEVPAVIANGVSYDHTNQDPDKDFIGHAWVMVYVNGKWLNIDPTWGLYSGNIPTSHIFFYYEGTNSSSYEISDYKEIDDSGITIEREEIVKDLGI